MHNNETVKQSPAALPSKECGETFLHVFHQILAGYIFSSSNTVWVAKGFYTEPLLVEAVNQKCNQTNRCISLGGITDEDANINL